MRKLIVLSLLVFVCSCQLFKPKHEFRFICGFENETNISNIEIQKTIKVLENRLASFGIQPEIKRFGEKQIEVIIRASKLNVERVGNLITDRGKLEFWELYKGDEMLKHLISFDSEQNKEVEGDTLNGKLMEMVTATGYRGGPVICHFKEKDTSYINRILAQDAFNQSLPMGKYRVKFLWGLLDDGNVPLYAAKSNRDNKAPLTGSSITNAHQTAGYSGKPEVSIEMDKEGALIWERLTGKAFQDASQIAIVLNNIVYSAPGVTVGAIKGGRSSISGNFTIEEAQNLAVILSSREPIPQLKILEETIVNNK